MVHCRLIVPNSCAGIPERPVNVTVADVAPRSVLLRWIEPHDNNAEITDYEVEIRDDTDSNSPPVTQRTMGAVEMLNVTGLKPFNNYTFVVFANNSLGRSPPSAPVTTRTDESSEWDRGESVGMAGMVGRVWGWWGWWGECGECGDGGESVGMVGRVWGEWGWWGVCGDGGDDVEV